MLTRPIFLWLTLLVGVSAVAQLEYARFGINWQTRVVGETPVTTLSSPDADGPHVVIAHGFAGSREMMQGYGLVLAQAGYRVHMFDFEGHGAHPRPMTGEVNLIEGATRRLVDQTLSVIDDVADDATPVALLGHSMATDVLIRASAASEQTGPLVLLSAFSQAVTAEHPEDMLILSGQWEPQLRAFGLRAARMLDPTAEEGDIVRSDAVIRSAMLAPYTEHVAILQSRAGRVASLNWLNRFYDRTALAPAPPTGWAFMALMSVLTLLAAPLARRFKTPVALPPKRDLHAKRFALVLAIPACVTPAVAAALDRQMLPVLVADYLAIHLGLYGLITLVALRALTGPLALGRVHAVGMAALLVWGLGVFGLALDRYGANFFPIVERLPIIAALALGAVPFMLADATLVWKTTIWRRIAARMAFLASLGIAVAIDFQGLFFLIMIAPVIVLFFFVHGAMGRAFGKSVGPLTAGLALGLILAWALGVSFPMFSA